MPRFSAYNSGAAVLAGAMLLALPVAASAENTTGVTDQVSVSSAEEDGNGSVFDAEPSISADGRYVVFASDADNLVPDDTNDAVDVFVRDRLSGTTERVSVTSNGKEGELGAGSSLGVGQSITADGRYVTFSSTADLAAGDNDPDSDVFVHDRTTGETTRVSVASDGTEASGQGPSISDDGRIVAFVSDSVVLNDSSFPTRQMFVHDRQTGVTERISEAPDGTVANRGTGFGPYLSADGRFVYFGSSATNLVPVQGERDDTVDAFLYDRQTDTMAAITSHIDADSFVTNKALPGGISPNGRYVTFTAGSDGFITPDDNDFSDDAWLVDTQTDPFTYTLVSRNDAGAQANEESNAGPVSNDGNLVAFESRGTNLDGPTRFGFHIYLRDVQAGTTRVVSVAPDGGEFGRESRQPAMTPDGRVVGFHNPFFDTYVRDMRPAADLAVSMSDSPDPVLERDQVTYTVTVDNNGPGKATDVSLVDTLPVDPTFVSAAASQGTCARDVNSNSGGVLTCDLGTLASGESATVLIVVSPRRAEPITNTATADTGAPDPNTANNTASETTAVQPR
ncbi:MAG TPA: CARDB domain-containing protein [Nocardioidaceae bacterium]|nr:CARDB domain-containing protein [Nocardioidaceae bacterium]